MKISVYLLGLVLTAFSFGGTWVTAQEAEPEDNCWCEPTGYILNGQCEQCPITSPTAIVLDWQRGVCSPFILATSEGCEPEADSSCSMRVGFAYGDPCNFSVVLSASAGCQATSTAIDACPGGGLLTMQIGCSDCTWWPTLPPGPPAIVPPYWAW